MVGGARRMIVPLGVALCLSAVTTLRARAGDRPVDGLDSLADATLARALEILEIRPDELGFDKLYAEDDTFRLTIVEEILADPLRLPGWQMRAVNGTRESVTSVQGIVRFLGGIAEAVPRRETPRPTLEAERSVDEAAREFVRGMQDANAVLDAAFRGLTPEDRQGILVLAPAFWGDWEDPDSPDRHRKGMLHRALGAAVDTSQSISADGILDAATRLDRSGVTEAAEAAAAAWSRFCDALSRLPEGRAKKTLEGVTGKIVRSIDTPFGLLVIGGPGDNVYSARALERIAFLYEPGGSDVYRGRVAAAAGGLGHAFSALRDRSGDDLYDAGDGVFAVAGAVLGVALLEDDAGNDVYRAGDGSLGAGFFGAGVLVDSAGRDLFEGRNFCQGAGAFGLGALVSLAAAALPAAPPPEVDRAFVEGFLPVPRTGAVPVRHDDNDQYICARQSQGFASTFAAGLLYDAKGSDLYRAGGMYLHRPLLPHDFQALSQGFSIGFRPRAAGGVGLLVDEQGNDVYDAEVYAQGASYWYSIGMLYDGAGNDRYVATQYAQGAGIHLAIGALRDEGGDDHYISKFGVTQGTAHDLSVGYLLDRSGNDYYVVDNGQGMSITNSSALFIDEQGDDLYATIHPGQGTLTWARGFCGAGVFLDLEGNDAYPAGGGGGDGAVWSHDLYAVGVDLDRDVQLPGDIVPEIVLTAADSTRSIEELFATSCIWEVGSAREKVARARKALLTKGVPAVDYAARTQLASDDGLVYRAILELARAYPDSFAARVIGRLDDRHPQVRRNVISLLGELKRREARESFEGLLRREELSSDWPRVLQALGRLEDRAAAPSIREFLHDTIERRRIAAIGALAALRDTASVPLLVEALDDPLLTVRSAAVSAIAGFRLAAVDPLLGRGIRAGDRGDLAWVQTVARVQDALRDPKDVGERAALDRLRSVLMRVYSDTTATDSERSAAVSALLSSKNAAATEAIRAHRDTERSPMVRRAVERGLTAD